MAEYPSGPRRTPDTHTHTQPGGTLTSNSHRVTGSMSAVCGLGPPGLPTSAQPPSETEAADRSPAEAAEAATCWPDLPADVLLRVARLLPRNEVALALQLLDRRTAGVVRAAGLNVVCLAQPVPALDFAARWATPGACAAYSLRQRRLQLCRVAGSGGPGANLRLLAGGVGDTVGAAGCALTADVFRAAAAAAGGEAAALEACEILQALGCPWGPGVAAAAAGAGHVRLLEWLLAAGCPANGTALLAAAQHGREAALRALLTAGGEAAWGAAGGRAGEALWSAVVEAAAGGGHAGALALLLGGGWGRPAGWALEGRRVVVAAAYGCQLEELQVRGSP